MGGGMGSSFFTGGTGVRKTVYDLGSGPALREEILQLWWEGNVSHSTMHDF